MKSFRKMKEKRVELGRKAYEAVASEYRKQQGRVEGYHANACALDALTEAGRNDIAEKIKNCQHGRRCQYFWCSRCRSAASDAGLKMMRKRILSLEEVYETLTGQEADLADGVCSDFMNQHILHASGYVGLVSLDVDVVKKALSFDRKRWKRIRERKSTEPFWVAGNYEFELVNFKALLHDASQGCVKKQKQIRQLTPYSKNMGWIQGNEDAVLLVHWHGITSGSRKQLVNAIGQEYYIDGRKLYKVSECGLYVQKLHGDKKFLENLRKVASYGFKNPTRYKHSFVGGDVGNELMTRKELSDLIYVYGEVQGREWKSLMLQHTIGG